VIDFFILLLVGCIGGISAGLFGIGGGVIMTPSLIFYFKHFNLPEDLIFRLSFGTSLFTIIFNSASGYIKHFCNGNVIKSVIISLGLFSILGGLSGSFLAAILPGSILKKIFGIILFYVSVRLFLKSRSDKIYKGNIKNLYLIFTGFSAGLIAAITGLGGGIILIPVMITLLKFPMKKVAGTSCGVIIFISIASSIGYIINGANIENMPKYSIGYVNLKAAIPLIIGSVSFAPVGAILNYKIKTEFLKKIFALFLMIIAIKIAFF